MTFQPEIWPATGELRLDRSRPIPWQYCGHLSLPAGRHALVEARVVESNGARHFELRAGLQPGMSAAELEGALAACEKARADKAIADGQIFNFEDDEVPL